MAGDCTYNPARYGTAETFCPSEPWSDRDEGEMDSTGTLEGRGPMRRSPHFEVIDGLIYRKKLERGFINYREVLDEERRHEAICAFHRRRPGLRHLSLEETYKCVAENYWWEGMYFQIRNCVLGCAECLGQSSKRAEHRGGGGGRVSKTMTSHSDDMLSKLRSQREAGLFCDITLQTDGRSYSAHRAVLAAVSEYFQEIFTEMDSSTNADVDLTGFSEESLLPLLDFSYSSTLCVRQEDLPEVIAMARHLGMWPAVEACSALLKEQEQLPSRRPRTEQPGRGFPSASAGSQNEPHHQQRKRKRTSTGEDGLNDSFTLMLDASDESAANSPRRDLRGTPRLQPQGHNCLPLSPTHRMKLMDFKSPSSKRAAAAPRNAMSTPQSRNCPPPSPAHTRLLRSSPGAAQEVQKLLPRLESPRRNRKSHSVPRPPRISRPRPIAVGSPVRIKQEVEEVGEDEEDCARAQEKYRLMNVLGLQRTALLPRPEDLIGWRQKKRLRKLKANNYSLTKRRKPRPPVPALAFGVLPLSLPLCNPVNTRFLNRVIKTEPGSPISTDEMRVKRRRSAPRHIPPSDRSMRSKGALPDVFQPVPRPAFGGRELRRSARRAEGAPLPSQQPPCYRNSNNPVRSKAEPAEYSISGPPLPSNSHCGHTQPRRPPPLRTPAKNKVTIETVKALRYNSGRPATKAKLRRNATRATEKPREQGMKAGAPGLMRVMDTSLRVQDNESTGLPISDPTPPPSIYNHPLYKVIKEEPADPLPVAGPFPNPPSPDLGKRQSKPPIKLLDPGFLFSFCRPTGAPLVGVKREEETVDICLTRSVSQEGGKFGAEETQHRTLRARGGPPSLLRVKREKEEKSVSQRRVQNTRSSTLHLAKSTGSRTTRATPKQQGKRPLSSRKCALLESIRQVRLKQLRGPRSQAPKAPKAAHDCQLCRTSYRDCYTLIMHRLRHVEGKHWPCPLCSKTFFCLKNVRNHIRNHDQKLYKCRSCIAAAS